MEISQIINAIFGSLTNIIAAVVITVGLTLALFGTFKSSSHKFIRHFARQSPAILATVGIFFSFWGISIGLIGLDLNDIQNSIPKLLDGLKVKFIASLMGIGASIIVRITQNFAVEESSLDNDSDLLVLQELRKQTDLLKRIDDSILEGFGNQIKKFDDFAQSVAQDSNAALIEALEAVMRDFNTKINEQFADNFKELNRAVGALLQWQENYKNHVDKLNDNFEMAIKSIIAIQNVFGDIQTRSQDFSIVSTELSGILKKLDGQLYDLNHHLRTLDDVASNAKRALPLIEENVMNLTNGFKQSVEKSLLDINNSVDAVSKNLTQSSNKIESSQKTLENELENTLNQMTSKLTGLSARFVEDYGKMTTHLKDVLKVVDQLKQGKS